MNGPENLWDTPWIQISDKFLLILLGQGEALIKYKYILIKLCCPKKIEQSLLENFLDNLSKPTGPLVGPKGPH